MIYGNKYQVSWRHNNNGSNTPGSTQCLINKVVREEGEEVKYEPIVSGLAKCCPTDHYNKKLGRKISFTRAVAQIATKEERKLLWAEFIKNSPRCLSCY